MSSSNNLSRRNRSRAPSAGQDRQILSDTSRQFFEQQDVALRAASKAASKRQRTTQNGRPPRVSVQEFSGESDAATEISVMHASANGSSNPNSVLGDSSPVLHRVGSDPHTLLAQALEFRMGFQAAVLLEVDPVKRQELEVKLAEASEIYSQRLQEALLAFSLPGSLVPAATPLTGTPVFPPTVLPVSHAIVSAAVPPAVPPSFVEEGRIRAIVSSMMRGSASQGHSKEFMDSIRPVHVGAQAFDGGVSNDDGKRFPLLRQDNNALEFVARSLCAWRMVKWSRAEKLGDLGGLKVSLPAVSRLASRAIAFGRNHQVFQSLEERSLTVAYEFRQAHLWYSNDAGEYPVLLQFFLGDFRFDRNLFSTNGTLDTSVGLNVFSAFTGDLPATPKNVDKSFVLGVINSWSNAFTCLCDVPTSASDQPPASWKSVFDDLSWRVRADDLQHAQPCYLLDAFAASLESWFSVLSSSFFLGSQRYAFTTQTSAIWLLSDILHLISMDPNRIEIWRTRCLEAPRSALVCCYEDSSSKVTVSPSWKSPSTFAPICLVQVMRDVLDLEIPPTLKFSCPGSQACGRRHLEPSDIASEKDKIERLVRKLLSFDSGFQNEVLAKLASFSA